VLNLEDFSNFTTEQIRKLREKTNKEVDELEARLKKKTLLKFSTSNDELLRQLTEQLYISNKLSVATYKKKQINGSINPYQSGKDVERLEVSDVDYKTIVVNFGNTTIIGSEKIYELEGSGIVSELMFKSSTATVLNRAYGVRIMSDNSISYQDTWDNCFNRSFHEVDMACWIDGIRNYYILEFQDIMFAKNLIIQVYGSSASFTDIYLKYFLKV